MIRIDKQYYANFYDIFNELPSYTFLLSALDGIVKGKLYADDANKPTYAVMLTADCYYIVGDLSDAQVGQEIFALSQSGVFNDYEGIIFSKKNLNRIREIFGEHTYAFIERVAYQILKSEFVYSGNATDGVDSVSITPENIDHFKDFKNFKATHDDAKAYWDEYPQNSRIAFCNALVKNSTILARCFLNGESSSKNVCELDIETFEGFRKKGYAVTVCNEAMKAALELGYDRINWNCHVHNIASNKTALKLGFKQVDESYLAWFKKNLT